MNTRVHLLTDRLRGRLRAIERRSDAGTTMIELVVGMTVMTMFMGMFTAAMYLMSSTTNKVQVIADTTNQSTTTFLRLDREVRYASALSTPAYDSTARMWHVEFLTSGPVRTGTNGVSTVSQCTQLAVAPPTSGTDGGVLERRTWSVGDTRPLGWTVLASNVVNYASTDTPFPTTTAIAGANTSTQLQQLTVSLILQTTSPATTQTKSSYTFTAVNSSSLNTSPVCQQFPVSST